MGVAAAEVGRLLSCSKENFYADESGCKVRCLEMSSSEKLIILHIVLQYYGSYLNHSEKETVLLLLQK